MVQAINCHTRLADLMAEIYKVSSDSSLLKTKQSKDDENETKKQTKISADAYINIAGTTWKTSFVSVAISAGAMFAPNEHAFTALSAFGSNVPSAINGRWTAEEQSKQAIANGQIQILQNRMSHASQNSAFKELEQVAARALEQALQAQLAAARG